MTGIDYFSSKFNVDLILNIILIIYQTGLIIPSKVKLHVYTTIQTLTKRFINAPCWYRSLFLTHSPVSPDINRAF